ncbi:MAG: hypothetical protein KBD00_04770 [Candidatus Peribacteraceae bacterium]|nr:hypothetical protein [Candidatus Peribacteraceae bacterium]
MHTLFSNRRKYYWLLAAIPFIVGAIFLPSLHQSSINAASTGDFMQQCPVGTHLTQACTNSYPRTCGPLICEPNYIYNPDLNPPYEAIPAPTTTQPSSTACVNGKQTVCYGGTRGCAVMSCLSSSTPTTPYQDPQPTCPYGQTPKQYCLLGQCSWQCVNNTSTTPYTNYPYSTTPTTGAVSCSFGLQPTTECFGGTRGCVTRCVLSGSTPTTTTPYQEPQPTCPYGQTPKQYCLLGQCSWQCVNNTSTPPYTNYPYSQTPTTGTTSCSFGLVPKTECFGGTRGCVTRCALAGYQTPPQYYNNTTPTNTYGRRLVCFGGTRGCVYQ